MTYNYHRLKYIKLYLPNLITLLLLLLHLYRIDRLSENCPFYEFIFSSISSLLLCHIYLYPLLSRQ